MSFAVKRVKDTDCPKCGYHMDVSAYKPLTRVPCPNCGTQVPVPAKLGAMYIHTLIGEGTGSIVYEAFDRVLGQPVAVKVMKQRKDNLGKQDNLQEARSLLMLDHPNVVKVHAIDTRRGQPCIIMEVLRGGSLKERFKEEGSIPEKEAVDIGIQICRGLHEAHEHGLLHLDVKPGNIMFDKGGIPKILDFGYAGVDVDDKPSEILGTPYYVAPELVRQETPDVRADIYSLGASLFHIISGTPPFDGEKIKDLVVKRLKEPPPDVRKYNSAVSERTSRVLQLMMAQDKDDRYDDYPETISALEGALEELK
ncbi:MAG: protein kinase [Phycisphaera sp.]|nr:protein kinase [Phycisphaera sp.]